MYYSDEYEREDTSLDAKDIEYLYEMRHHINCKGGAKLIYKHFKISENVLTKLVFSDLHGSLYIRDLLHMKEKEALLRLNELFEESNYYEYLRGLAYFKNEELIESLEHFRKNICTIGTNKLKRRLNKLALTDLNAKILRNILEIEDINIQAKKTYGKYQERKYQLKNTQIELLIDLYKTTNYNYGYHTTDHKYIKYIYFFDLPNNIQVSWHSDSLLCDKLYEKDWDGLENSTLKKVEDYVNNHYKNIIY